MSLGELIEILEAEPRQKLMLFPGFHHPHSYRGYYDDLAVEPCEVATVAECLATLQSAVGHTYTGWKGGEFTMGTYTTVWLAEAGCTSGDTLGPRFLRLIVAWSKVLDRDATLAYLE